MTKISLLNRLITDVENLALIVENEFKGLDTNDLNRKKSVDTWSALECFDHLNRYSAYYNKAIQRAIVAAKKTNEDSTFTNGWFGKLSINMMSPTNPKKQKTIARMNPAGSILGESVLTDFLAHQRELLNLLEQAKGVNINQRKVPVEFMNWMKMKIGDALTFVVVHQQRHLQQAQRAINN
ncbi:MAG: DinB family protein [Bacteroidota bacterium]